MSFIKYIGTALFYLFMVVSWIAMMSGFIVDAPQVYEIATKPGFWGNIARIVTFCYYLLIEHFILVVICLLLIALIINITKTKPKAKHQREFDQKRKLAKMSGTTRKK